ncbi:hypothetical protein GGI03_005878 [Coemansia sp. RSA 2337]|nr:hypothetical protein LPJ71_006099 [Coemansia sp. S17]KAJ2058255.1 hypothetical protein GGI08_003469 [Coemansia sp. S2]KAJ2345218.1 hypothetical protein GGH92_004138 [Coemansia sp. RSA 2673]KAJ2458217.1 hypothetical protein GGI03_005878 [Coemansia sp. RSA 2337]
MPGNTASGSASECGQIQVVVYSKNIHTLFQAKREVTTPGLVPITVNLSTPEHSSCSAKGSDVYVVYYENKKAVFEIPGALRKCLDDYSDKYTHFEVYYCCDGNGEKAFDKFLEDPKYRDISWLKPEDA